MVVVVVDLLPKSALTEEGGNRREIQGWMSLIYDLTGLFNNYTHNPLKFCRGDRVFKMEKEKTEE